MGLTDLLLLETAVRRFPAMCEPPRAMRRIEAYNLAVCAFRSLLLRVRGAVQTGRSVDPLLTRELENAAAVLADEHERLAREIRH